MVRGDPSWDFDYTAGREVAGRWLEEEEWLLWKCVLQFLDVIGVVTTYCNYLFDLWSSNRSENRG
jgi:hypothetical protein